MRRDHSPASGKKSRPANAKSAAQDLENGLQQFPGLEAEVPESGPMAEAALGQADEWAGALNGAGGEELGDDGAPDTPGMADPAAAGGPATVQVASSEGPRGEQKASSGISTPASGQAVASEANLAEKARETPAEGAEGADAKTDDGGPPDADSEAEAEGTEGESEAEGAVVAGDKAGPAEGEPGGAPGQDVQAGGKASPGGNGGAGGAPLEGAAAEGADSEAGGQGAPQIQAATDGKAAAPGPGAAPGGDIGQKIVLAVVRPGALGEVQPLGQLEPLADGSLPIQLAGASEAEAARARTGNAVALVEPQGMQAVAARRRGDAHTALEQFKAQAETKKQALAALKQKIEPAVQQARQEAQGRLDQTLQQQKAAITQAITQARATAEQEAASARSSIQQSHAQVTGQIKADATGARQSITQAHQTESANISRLKGEISGKVAIAFGKAADEARAAGKTAGDQAVAIAARRSQGFAALPIPKQGKLSGFFEGEDYEKNKHGAKVQAAKDVGKAYQAEFAKKAEETAKAMPQGQQQVVDGLTQRADAAGQAVEAAKTGALKQIDTREKGDLANADRVRDQKLAAVNGSVTGANRALAGLEQRKAAELDQKVQAQRGEIEQQAGQRSAGLAQMLDQAAEQLQSKIDETVTQAESVELPDEERLQQSLDEALGKLDEVVQQADQGISQGADELRTAFGQSHQQYQQTGDQTVQSAQQEAGAAAQNAAQTAQGEAQGAEQALQSIGKSSGEGMTKAKTDACKDIQDASSKLDADLTKVTGNLGSTLGKSTQDLNKDFQASLAGIDAEITSKANEAAGKVQPSWKKWVSIVLTIIISIIVTACIAALAASGIGLIALIGLSLLIGAAGGIAKMCVEKWATGEDITWKDVGKAAAIGAIEGLINVIGAGAGSAAAGALEGLIVKKFGEEIVKKFAVKAAIFMAETVVGTVIDTIGSGLTDTIGRIWDGKEVSLKTFWDAMTGNVIGNFIGNFGGGLLAPYFGKALAKMGIGKAAAKEATEGATKQAAEAATKQATEQVVKAEVDAAAKQVAEQTVKAEVEAAAKQAAERAAKDAAEQTTKEAAEALIKQEAEKAAKEAAEALVKQEAEKAAKEAAEAVAKQEAEKATKQAAEIAAKQQAEQAAKQAAEATAKQEAEKAAKEAAEQAAKEAKVTPVKEEPKLLPAPKEEPKLLGPAVKEEPKLLPAPKDEPKLLPAPKDEPKLPAAKEKVDADAKTDTPKVDADAGVKADLHAKVDETVGPMKGNMKESPLRAEYEGKVAELKKLAESMATAGKSPEEIARALHQARRDLGHQFKDLTPGPLRKYIYEVNLERYGDELGPSFEFLMKKYEKDLAAGTIADRKAIFDKIIGASSRPNENVDKLLQNFGDWLKKQDPAYIEKALVELKAPRPSGGGGGGHTSADAKVDTSATPKDTPKIDGEAKTDVGPKTEAKTEVKPDTKAEVDAGPNPKVEGAPPAPKGAQRTADIEQLYKDAAVAQKELSDATLDIAGKTGGKPIIPDKLKGRERAMEKVNVDYKGDASRLTDLARASVEYKKLDDVYKGLEILKSKYEIVNIKDRFSKPTSAGYRDILLTVRMSNGHVCEVQLHLEQILAVKGGEGHHLYEIIRKIESDALKDSRQLTAAELKKIEWANSESRRLYQEAIEKAMGGN